MARYQDISKPDLIIWLCFMTTSLALPFLLAPSPSKHVMVSIVVVKDGYKTFSEERPIFQNLYQRNNCEILKKKTVEKTKNLLIEKTS